MDCHFTHIRIHTIHWYSSSMRASKPPRRAGSITGAFSYMRNYSDPISRAPSRFVPCTSRKFHNAATHSLLLHPFVLD